MNICVLLVLLAIAHGPLAVRNNLFTSSFADRQSKSNATEFEVVSVRACDPNAVTPGGGRSGWAGAASPGRLRLVCQSAYVLVHLAYSVYENGRFNPPATYPTIEWPKAFERLGSEVFTIEAKTEGTPAVAAMRGPMLQRVLEDRFKLKVHYETREMPIYELVVAKSGLKMKPFKPGGCVPYDPDPLHPPLEPDQRRCENSTSNDANGNWVLNAEAMTLDDLAHGRIHGYDPRRPVVNKTGITGLFTFRLAQGDGDDIVPALKSQLGLELRPAKGPQRFLVIDHIERPSPNAPSAIGNKPMPAMSR